MVSKGAMVIKYLYPDGTHCFRAMHTAHAVFYSDEGVLIARAAKPDGTLYEFEITGFELVGEGFVYS